MKITNEYNLPQPIVRAVTNDPYTRGGAHISVTGLISPPRKRILEARHDEKISVDASERIWSLLGQSVHHILERSGGDGVLTEERLSIDVNGWRVSGQADLLEADMTLSDYKVTSVYSFLLGDKPEWEAQLNMYAHLYRRNGFEPKRLQIVAILRDWTSSKAAEADYPKAPCLCVEVPMWPDEKAAAFIAERVGIHQAADARADHDLPACTSAEMWERPTTYAVKKVGGKRAINGGVCTTMDEARRVQGQNPGTEVEVRAGERVRCERFCNAAPFCSIYTATKGAE